MLAKYSFAEVESLTASVVSEDVEIEKIDDLNKQMKLGLLNNSSLNTGGSIVSVSGKEKKSN